ncbi:MAG: type IV pilus assembly protein PilM, partial [Armatimonadaceae bacterium]
MRKARSSGGSFVGLDMGTSTIKIVEVTGARTGLRVTGLALEDTPSGLISQGVVTDPKQLGLAIKAALAKNAIRSRKCVVSVGGAAAMVVRVVDVPKMSAGELAETMKWQIEQYVPFPASDVELSYEKIDDPVTDADPNAQMEVLLAVAQRDMVSRHIETLVAAGLTPVAVDVEPLAAGRALINLSKEGYDQRNVVVVNIGATITDVGIFKSGVLRFPRTIPLGGDNFTRAIADRCGLGMDAAEDEKREVAAVLMDLIDVVAEEQFGATEVSDNGITSPWDVDTSVPLPPSLFGEAPAPAAEIAPELDANPFADPFAAPVEAAPAPAPEPIAVPEEVESPYSPREREVFQAILPVLGEFSMELRRSVDYFRSKFPMDTVDHVLLCGGGASLRGLEQ